MSTFGQRVPGEPAIRARLDALGIAPVSDSMPAGTAQTVEREIARRAKAFEFAGGRPE